MDKVSIKELKTKTELVYNLLFLADSSKDAVEDYINRGKCYGAYIDQTIVGVYVLLKQDHLQWN